MRLRTDPSAVSRTLSSPLAPRPPHTRLCFVNPMCVRAQNKTGAAPQQSKKEESKKNKRARYAADNQKTVLERQQVRVHHGWSMEHMTIYLPMPLGLLVHWRVVLLELNSPRKAQKRSHSNAAPVSAIAGVTERISPRPSVRCGLSVVDAEYY